MYLTDYERFARTRERRLVSSSRVATPPGIEPTRLACPPHDFSSLFLLRDFSPPALHPVSPLALGRLHRATQVAFALPETVHDFVFSLEGKLGDAREPRRLRREILHQVFRGGHRPASLRSPRSRGAPPMRKIFRVRAARHDGERKMTRQRKVHDGVRRLVRM